MPIVSPSDSARLLVPEWRGTLFAVRLEEARAEHRRDRQGDHQREKDGHRAADAELVEESANRAVHERHGHEDGGDRQGGGDGGETDLPRAPDDGVIEPAGSLDRHREDGSLQCLATKSEPTDGVN